MAALKIDEAFPDAPETEAEVRITIGKVYQRLGRKNEAELQLRKAFELRRSNLGDIHDLTLEALEDLIWLYRVYAFPEKHLKASRQNLAGALEYGDLLDEAEQVSREARDFVVSTEGPSTERASIARRQYGWLLLSMGELSSAESEAKRLYQDCLTEFGGHNSKTRGSRNLLSGEYLAMGDISSAKDLYNGRKAPDTLGVELDFQGSYQNLHDGIKILVFFETWCPFSQIYIPQVHD